MFRKYLIENINDVNLFVRECYIQEGEMHPLCNLTITGLQEVLPDQTNIYTISARDADGDDVFYTIKIGNIQMISEFVPSKIIVEAKFVFTDKSLYNVLVFAEYENGVISEPMSLLVTCSKNIEKEYTILKWFFEKLIQCFPLFEKILNQILLYPKRKSLKLFFYFNTFSYPLY